MTLAARTREAVTDHPFLVDALRAGVVNFAAAARFLDVDGDEEAVAVALRRYGEALPEYAPRSASLRVTMQSGLERIESGEAGSEPLLCVGERAYAATENGSRTAILATGSVDAAVASGVLEHLALAGVSVDALAFDADALVALVDRRSGADAVRAVERAADGVPDRPAGREL